MADQKRNKWNQLFPCFAQLLKNFEEAIFASPVKCLEQFAERFTTAIFDVRVVTSEIARVELSESIFDCA